MPTWQTLAWLPAPVTLQTFGSGLWPSPNPGVRPPVALLNLSLGLPASPCPQLPPCRFQEEDGYEQQSGPREALGRLEYVQI